MRPISPPHTHQASVSLFSPPGPEAMLGFRNHVCSSQGGAHHHPLCEGKGLPLYPLARMQWGPEGSVEGPGVEHIVPGTVLHLQSRCTLWEPLLIPPFRQGRGWESSAARAARSYSNRQNCCRKLIILGPRADAGKFPGAPYPGIYFPLPSTRAQFP